MMNDCAGRIVLSAAGRDKGAFLLCVGEREGFLLVCDGKNRPLERPKRKNPRHVIMTDDRLPIEGERTNRALRRALSRNVEERAKNAR